MPPQKKQKLFILEGPMWSLFLSEWHVAMDGENQVTTLNLVETQQISRPHTNSHNEN